MSDRHRILFLLALSFLAGMLFDLIPFVKGRPDELFVFIDGDTIGMSLEWYAYLAGEKISRMAIFYAFFKSSGLPIVQAFFVIECMDLGDFMLIANKPWTDILGFPIEFNTWKVCLISYFITADVWTNRQLSGY